MHPSAALYNTVPREMGANGNGRAVPEAECDSFVGKKYAGYDTLRRQGCGSHFGNIVTAVYGTILRQINTSGEDVRFQKTQRGKSPFKLERRSQARVPCERRGHAGR